MGYPHSIKPLHWFWLMKAWSQMSQHVFQSTQAWAANTSPALEGKTGKVTQWDRNGEHDDINIDKHRKTPIYIDKLLKIVVSYFRTKLNLLLHFIHLFFLQTYSTEFNDPENWMEEACTGLPYWFHGKHMVKTIFSCKSCLEPTHPTAPRVTCSLPRSKGTPWCHGRSTCRSSRPRVVCAGAGWVHAPVRITPGRAAIPACPGRMMPEWIIIITRRRMARERRGAGSSLVSMETPYYKQYIKDVL